MRKKIDITDEKKMVALSDGTERTVYRIKALRDFGDVKTGQLGGWIEKESNLSHDGNCFQSVGQFRHLPLQVLFFLVHRGRFVERA